MGKNVAPASLVLREDEHQRKQALQKKEQSG
jgi:hypothetical protein